MDHLSNSEDTLKQTEGSPDQRVVLHKAPEKQVQNVRANILVKAGRALALLATLGAQSANAQENKIGEGKPTNPFLQKLTQEEMDEMAKDAKANANAAKLAPHMQGINNIVKNIGKPKNNKGKKSGVDVRNVSDTDSETEKVSPTYLFPDKSLLTEQESMLAIKPTIVAPSSLQPYQLHLSKKVNCAGNTIAYFPIPSDIADHRFLGCEVEVRSKKTGECIKISAEIIKSGKNSAGVCNSIGKVEIPDFKGAGVLSVKCAMIMPNYIHQNQDVINEYAATNKIIMDSNIGSALKLASTFPRDKIFNLNNSTFDINKASKLPTGDCATAATRLCQLLKNVGCENVVVVEGFMNGEPHVVCYVYTEEYGWMVLDPITGRPTVRPPEGFIAVREGPDLNYVGQTHSQLQQGSFTGTNFGHVEHGPGSDERFTVSGSPMTPGNPEVAKLFEESMKEIWDKYPPYVRQLAQGSTGPVTQVSPTTR